MRETASSILFWTCALLVLSLGALAAHVGPTAGWTPGAAALALLAPPVAAAALSGRRATAFPVAVLAGAGCLLETWLAVPHAGAEPGLVFPVFAGSALLLLAGVVCAAAERLRLTAECLESQNAEYVRELYERSRREVAAGDAPEKPQPPVETVTGDHVDYAMLLLTIQDIGRRIATNLDLETLVPTIVSSAQASLRCGDCEVYLWNPRTETLTVAVPQRSRDRFVPRPHAGVGRWVLQRRQILTRRAVEEDYELRTLLEDDPRPPDAVAPLCVGGELLGLLVIERAEHDSPDFVRLLYVLANIYALGIKNAQLFKRVEEMARRDGLTGLLNHATFMQEYARLLGEAERTASPLAVVMCDVDHFKQFNDRHGHRAGDHVLRETARLWKALLPESAIVGRYGGEEFIWALPNTTLEAAREWAETLRESLAAHPLDFEGKHLTVTASFGVTESGPHAPDGELLLRLADEGLYKAKAAGRNCVVCCPVERAIAAAAV